MPWYKKFVILTSLMLLLCMSVAVLGYRWLDQKAEQTISLEQSVFLTVKKGENLSSLIRYFEQQQWLTQPLWLKLYIRLHPELAKVRAGTYQIQASDTWHQLLAKLANGQEHQFYIQFIEGSQFTQWLAQLNNEPHLVPISEQQLQALAQQLKLNNGFEGLLFPDNYAFTSGTPAQDILLRAYQNMQQQLAQAWQQRGEDLPLKTPYQALILASIIEKETAKAAEYPVIASVFINRLNKNMRLQTDPTVIYGLGEQFNGDIKRIHLKQKTPYNTYRIKGLPPTPIAMPSYQAIWAALHPATTDYLYFVSNGQGEHIFSTNITDHNKAVRKYQLGKS